MPSYPSNNSTTFNNINDCRSFNQSLSTTLAAFAGYPCSEVIIINKTGQTVYIYDNNYFSDSNRLMLSDGDSIALRGISNSATVSAKTASGSGTIYYRTQYYSLLPQV